MTFLIRPEVEKCLRYKSQIGFEVHMAERV
jgi:hypothetical protein